ADLFGGDPFQEAVLLNLTALRLRPGAPLPEAVAERCAAWALLRDHFEKASAVSEEQSQLVANACECCRLDALTGLRGSFGRTVLPREPGPELLEDFAGFFHSFFPGTAALLARPREGDFHAIASRSLAWLELIRSCPDMEARRRYAVFYMDRHVPPT